jgi:hypothetical protein
MNMSFIAMPPPEVVISLLEYLLTLETLVGFSVRFDRI